MQHAKTIRISTLFYILLGIVIGVTSNQYVGLKTGVIGIPEFVDSNQVSYLE